ncbi:ribonuclease H-like domain-containing protein [Rhodanobacter sp. C05]|uniref:ribonuclease H-like domain-containing protein n=1 Tax=Rhodanobacter sp. C05 TaxID=1945855 RepID=UPI0009C60FA8|nr:ribonuclease H-like domain-containing protein [Rhodanobacter sp. C05]OOG38620.1 exonuclease [Rhodanobacter sp. C05]
MSALAARLRQLRTQSGQPSSVAPQKSALSSDVLRLIQGRSRIQSMAQRAPSSDRMVPGVEITPGLFLVETIMEWGRPTPMIDTAFARWDEPVAHHRLLHFDTETTGLAGGTGTRAWMIGAANWLADGRFRLRQLTTTTMGAETAMLRTFAGWLQPDTVLVSYNGKSYDSPLLRTRFRLARLPDPLLGLGHLDLLHPVRRRWKGAWENCRLATAERELLSVVREDDLPGSEAPAAWLTYLRGGSALNLRRVLAHNAQDLKSLAGVLLYMAKLAELPA